MSAEAAGRVPESEGVQVNCFCVDFILLRTEFCTPSILVVQDVQVTIASLSL